MYGYGMAKRPNFGTVPFSHHPPYLYQFQLTAEYNPARQYGVERAEPYFLIRSSGDLPVAASTREALRDQHDAPEKRSDACRTRSPRSAPEVPRRWIASEFSRISWLSPLGD